MFDKDRENPFIGIGRIPSQQVRVDETQELRLLLKYWWAGFRLALAGLVILYIVLNTWFDGADWYTLLRILLALSCLPLFQWGNNMAHRHWEERGGYGTYRGHLIVGACIGGLYILVHQWVVPMVVLILDFPDGVPLLPDGVWALGRTAATGTMIAFFAPSIPLLIRVIVEILDPYHHSIDLAQVERNIRHQEEMWNRQHPTALPPTDRWPVAVKGGPAAIQLPPGERSRLGVIDFLEGMKAKKWDETEGSWNGQILERSHLKLHNKLGIQIRNFLIRAGWAEWNDPSNHRSGWRLLAPVDDVIDGLRHYEPRAEQQSAEAEATAEPE